MLKSSFIRKNHSAVSPFETHCVDMLNIQQKCGWPPACLVNCLLQATATIEARGTPPALYLCSWPRRSINKASRNQVHNMVEFHSRQDL